MRSKENLPGDLLVEWWCIADKPTDIDKNIFETETSASIWHKYGSYTAPKQTPSQLCMIENHASFGISSPLNSITSPVVIYIVAGYDQIPSDLLYMAGKQWKKDLLNYGASFMYQLQLEILRSVT